MFCAANYYIRRGQSLQYRGNFCLKMGRKRIAQPGSMRWLNNLRFVDKTTRLDMLEYHYHLASTPGRAVGNGPWPYSKKWTKLRKVSKSCGFHRGIYNFSSRIPALWAYGNPDTRRFLGLWDWDLIPPELATKPRNAWSWLNFHFKWFLFVFNKEFYLKFLVFL